MHEQGHCNCKCPWLYKLSLDDVSFRSVQSGLSCRTWSLAAITDMEAAVSAESGARPEPTGASLTVKTQARVLCSVPSQNQDRNGL